MKSLSVLLSLLISSSIWGQDCDTVYSNSERVRITVEINYSNCYYLEIDTVYYWERYTTDPVCGKLLHHQTKKLIAQRWVSSDTNHYVEYYSNGNIKYESALFKNRNYIYQTDFYESGLIKKKREYLTDMFFKQTSYYKNGNKKSEAYYCEACPGPWNEYLVYYPSGQISSRKTFTTYHDSLSRSYHETEELTALYFDEKGRKITSEQNRPDYLSIALQPKWVGENPVTKINDTIYTCDQFSDQTGYDNELLALKKAIQEQLQFPTKCNCKKGVAWIEFIIDSNGNFGMIGVDFPNEEVKRGIETAIKKLNKWSTAKVNNEAVSVYVYTWLALDE